MMTSALTYRATLLATIITLLFLGMTLSKSVSLPGAPMAVGYSVDISGDDPSSAPLDAAPPTPDTFSVLAVSASEPLSDYADDPDIRPRILSYPVLPQGPPHTA
ncbi:hypothetical protein [Marinobacter sp. BGYM27]|uniref:hypothetical protein n=1 Tax=Marinobacter sp. BGYM27 TaxID=2975597 RepID=UPI0021A7B369|nr:hypothetical protein [Marinobacter sp. BGYM27]MDG5499482.1 hypothetical protein [Marinobacter sp. BGYM27]